MNGHWFRFYDSVVDDPKVQRLSLAMFRLWVNILCLASRNGGNLPSFVDMAFSLRMTEKQLVDGLSALKTAGLVDDELDGASTPHNWGSRQFQSDVSTERVKRFRERHPKRDETVSRNAPETETETDQKKNLSREMRSEFEKQFWPICPRKAGKGAAFKAFLKARKIINLDPLLAAMRSYALTRAGEEERFTAHPASWLNAERWNDEPAKPSLLYANGHDPPGETLETIIARARAMDEKPDAIQ